ncbi:hypothetical protein BGZ49_010128, partial [Haplosporangium sp. Z 27]
MSTLEFASPSSRENTPTGVDGNSDNAMVAQCDLVPSNQGDVDISTDSNPTRGVTTSTRKCKRPTEQEPTLVLNSMKNKRRRRGIGAGLFSSAIDLLDTADANSLTRVCAFLRPDDIGYIDISKTKVSDNGLLLSVIFPKECRDGQRIIKVFSVGRHANDKRLCPVDAYEEYTRRIADTPLEINNYKDPNYTFTLLI